MGIFQILLLQCLVLSIFAGISAETDLLSNNSKENIQECYCVPITDSEMRVSEILTSELQQDERLVVYLYKNSHNEVTIYIPNSVKQKDLPEFTLDDDDVLKKNVTVNTNDLFYLDNSDMMVHESNGGLDNNLNQFLDIPNSLTLSNLPYLITGYMQFLPIPLNIQNVPNCCDITLPGPIHHHLNGHKESTCCANTITLLQSLFGINTHLPTSSKEIAINGLESNEDKDTPPNVDTIHPQDVRDHIPESSKENKPLSPDGINPVWDSIIHQSNKEKPSNSDIVHPQDVIDIIVPPSSEETPLNSDNVHPQYVLDLIKPPSDEVDPSNSDNVHSQDVLDLIIPPPNKENPSKSDNTHEQDVLDVVIPESNEVKPSKDVLDYIISETNKENVPLNPDGIQNGWEFIVSQLNEEKPESSDMEHPQDVLDYLIQAQNEENILSNPDDVLDRWNLIIPQLSEETPSKLHNVYPQDLLHHIILEINKNKKPANLHHVYPQNVLDSKKDIKSLNPDNNYQVHVQDGGDYKNYEIPIPQDLMNQQNYEISIARDLKDKQQYTKPDQIKNPFLIFHDPKHSKDYGKYNDNMLMLLNKYISSLKEKDSYLFNQNKTSGSLQINDHYNNLISELNRPQINYRPSQGFAQITLDQWLTLQVKLFKKYKFTMSYTIDIKMLKLLLQKTLYKNGISMTNAGDLIDVNGERLSIDRLELRPVLIGDPLKYEEFLSSNDCVIPSKFPYIEAILVRLSKPRRFLGLISLSDASFFDSRRSGSLICPPTSNEISFTSIPIKSESLLEYNDLWNKRNSLNDLPDYQDKLWGSKKTNVKLNNKEFSGFEDISPPKELSSEDNNDGDVGLRIIGGQAATSSGTPVSSRGRRSVNDLNEIR